MPLLFSKNYQDIERLAHSIKGDAAMLGMQTLSKQGKLLELCCRNALDTKHISQLIENLQQELALVLADVALLQTRLASLFPHLV